MKAKNKSSIIRNRIATTTIYKAATTTEMTTILM